jgi:hypothetical protein
MVRSGKACAFGVFGVLVAAQAGRLAGQPALSDSPPGPDAPPPAVQPAPAPEGKTVGDLTKAVITRRNARGEKPKEYHDTVREPQTLKRLASFFPGLGQGKTSPVAGPKPDLARIEFFQAGGKAFTVRVDGQLDVWSEGRGNWALAPEFRDVFVGLLGDHPGVEYPGEPFARGEPLKPTKASIIRYTRSGEKSVTEVNAPPALSRLAAYFPGAGQGRQSPVAAGWESALKIEFARPGRDPVTISCNDRLSSWSDGNGTWHLRPGLADVLKGIDAAKR